MSRNPRIPVLVSTLLLVIGCASGPKPNPAPPTDAKDARPTAELITRGRDALSRGDSVRAEQYLSLAIEEGAESRVVLPILLRACLRSSHLRAAVNYAEPYLLAHPEDDSLRYLVAVIHLGLGQVAAAKRELGLLLQRNENNADAHYLLGVIEAAYDFESAKAHFGLVIEHSKDEEQVIEVKSRLVEVTLRERELSRDVGSTVTTFGETP